MTDAVEDLAEKRARRRGSGAAWKERLLVTPTKTPRPLLANALLALREAPEWQGVLAYDEFGLVIMTMAPPPWQHGCNSWEPYRWSDRDDVLTANWLQQQGICVNERVAGTAVHAVAQDASFHPIKDYLHGLEWDGVPRVEGFAITHLGAEDTIYHRTIMQCFFVSAVARIEQPGCKADHIPILEGAQGVGKSTVAFLLFDPWFSDDIAELGSKDASMQVRVAWGIELAELSSMRQGENEKYKAFISRRVDRFRPSYGRHVIAVLRQSVFLGTTNADAYLKDETGARRSWPVRCGRIDLAAIKRDRDQLWAEAVSLYRDGEPWWLVTPRDVDLAGAEQAARFDEDAWAGIIAEYLAGKSDVSVGEVLSGALGMEQKDWEQRSQNRVVRCLKVRGWEQRGRGPRPKQEKRYRPIEQPDHNNSNVIWSTCLPFFMPSSPRLSKPPKSWPPGLIDDTGERCNGQIVGVTPVKGARSGHIVWALVPEKENQV